MATQTLFLCKLPNIKLPNKLSLIEKVIEPMLVLSDNLRLIAWKPNDRLMPIKLQLVIIKTVMDSPLPFRMSVGFWR